MMTAVTLLCHSTCYHLNMADLLLYGTTCTSVLSSPLLNRCSWLRLGTLWLCTTVMYVVTTFITFTKVNINCCFLICHPFSQESCERALKLCHGYQRVADILQEKVGSGAGAKRSPSSAPLSRTERSQLSLHCVTRLLRALFRCEAKYLITKYFKLFALHVITCRSKLICITWLVFHAFL